MIKKVLTISLIGSAVCLASCSIWEGAAKQVEADSKLKRDRNALDYSQGMAEKRQERMEGYIKSQCISDSIVGTRKRVEGDISFTREKLRSLKGAASGTVESSLSQTLEGYSAEWELLNQQGVTACKLFAECKFEAPPEKDCSIYANEYFSTTKETRALVIKLRDLKSKTAEAELQPDKK